MNGKYNILFFIVLLLSVYSCNKNSAPTTSVLKDERSIDQAKFSSLFVEAIKYKHMGNAGDALKLLEQCIRLFPESDAAYYEMAEIVLANGDIKNGKKYASTALKLKGDNLWYIKMLAGIYHQEGNLDSAIYWYEKAVHYYPAVENLQLILGNLYSDNKNFDKAISIFEEFDEKYGVNEASTLSSIRCLMAQKKYDEARLKAESLVDKFPDEIMYRGILAEIYRGYGENEKAWKIYEELIKKSPDDPQTQLSLCEFLITEKNYSELFNILNSLILNEKVKREDKISLLARLINEPKIVERWYDNMIVSIMILEANYKDDPVIPLLRTELMINKNNVLEAKNRLEEIINEQPDNYYAWEKLLLIYLEMRDFKNLMNKGKDCATRFNRSFLAKILYANGAIENGGYEIALEELKKAEILAGEDSQLIMQVLTMRADTYYRMKDYNKAFEIFEEALKYNKEDLTVLNNYAYYLAEQDLKLKEAEEMAKSVIEKEKENTTYLDTYAWVLYKRGKIKEAERIMQKIINSGEKPDAEWYEHYGYILKKGRNFSKAAEIWKIAIKLDPTKSDLQNEIDKCLK